MYKIILSEYLSIHNVYVVKSLSSFDTGNGLFFLSKMRRTRCIMSSKTWRTNTIGSVMHVKNMYKIILSEYLSIHNVYVVKSLSSFYTDTGNSLFFLSKNAEDEMYVV